jgi:hypothetical protein
MRVCKRGFLTHDNGSAETHPRLIVAQLDLSGSQSDGVRTDAETVVR